jgi:hypothetical protein
MKKTAAVIAAIVAVLALLFIATEQTAPPEMTEAEVAQIEAEVFVASDYLVDGWNAHDAETFLAMFHPNKVSHAWGGRIWTDHDELSEEWAAVMETTDSVGISWTDRNVRVVTDQVAMFQGSTDLTIYYTDGRIVQYPGTAHWTGLFEPSEAGWKMTTSAYTFGGAQRLDQPEG